MMKKIVAVTMSLALVLSSGTMTALAEGSTYSSNGNISVDYVQTEDNYGAVAAPVEAAESAGVTVKEDVSVENKGEDVVDVTGIGAIADTDNGDTDKTAKVKVGEDVTVKNEGKAYDTKGIYVETNGEEKEANASATVGGELNVSSIDSESTGVNVNTYGENSNAYVSIGGNINVTGSDGGVLAEFAEVEGIDVFSRGGKTNIEVGNDINVISNDYGTNEIFNDVNGIYVTKAFNEDSPYQSNVEITVSGNVNVISYEERTVARGVDLWNEGGGSSINVDIGKDLMVAGAGDAVGIRSRAFTNENTSNNNVIVGGNVSVAGSGEVVGIEASTVFLGEDTELSHINIQIGGDVESSGDGVKLKALAGGTIDLTIDGTLSAKNGTAVVLEEADGEDLNQENRINITVWKIESGDSKTLVKSSKSDDEEGKKKLVSDATSKAVQENINYILKVDPNNKNGTEINFTGDNVVTNDIYQTAKAYERVGVQLKFPDGYELKNVYADKDRSLVVTKDSTGYWFDVPSGGGVLIYLELTKISNNNGSGDSSDNNDDSDRYISGSPLSDKDYHLNDGVLIINVPGGKNAFSIDSSVLLAFKALGMNTIYIDSTYGKFTIPFSNIQDLVVAGNILNFVLRDQVVDLYLNQYLRRCFYAVKKA